MKKTIKLLLLATAALGVVAVTNSNQTVHADNQFYSIPDANTNVKKINSGNVLANYSDSDLVMSNNQIPNVPRPTSYTHTNLNMTGTNNLDTYTSTDGSNTFSTMFYLPEGFHVQYGEHGNYQKALLVGNSFYIVESMGTGKNQGAIIKYNINDLRDNGILDGEQDMIWKALKYFSPYTVSGNNHSAQYLKDTTNLQNAKQTITNSQKQIKTLQAQIKPLKSQIKKLESGSKKGTKAQKPTLKKVQAQQKALDNQATLIARLNGASDNNTNDSNSKSRNTTVVSDVNIANYYQVVKKQAGQIKSQNAALKKVQSKSASQVKAALANNTKISKGLSGLVKQAKALTKKYAKSNKQFTKKQAQLNNVNTKINNLKQKITTSNAQVTQLGKSTSLLSEYSKLAHLAQISPLINIGHGETLAYNPANQHIYLAQDDSTKDQISTDKNNQVTEIDPNTLQPVTQYSFKLLHDNVNYQMKTLTFDSQGNAYIGRNYSSKSNFQIFKGRLDENGVSFVTEKNVINRPGYTNQGISYNAANNRLYIVSDDALTSVPVDELNNGTVNNDDIHYLTFNTNREFEDITFDSQGRGYLLMLWKPEILKSQNPMN